MNESLVTYKHFSKPLNSILYLINFILVLTVIFSATMLTDYALKELFPNELARASMVSLDGIAFAIASIVVATPLYFLILFFLRRGEERFPPIVNSLARKTTYILIIIITFCYLVGILIASVFGAILGNLTLAYGLSSLGGIVITSVPLAYYLIQLRK